MIENNLLKILRKSNICGNGTRMEGKKKNRNVEFPGIVK
jgi:hypothetical protein